MDAYQRAISAYMPAPDRYVRYLDLVFEGVPLAGQSMLDVGGGDGRLSFYAAARGAGKVVCLDPAADGSSPGIDEQFTTLATHVGGNVNRLTERFQEHDPGHELYDVVLVHNAINHLDESACAALPDDSGAISSYREIFASLRSLLRTGGHIIVADCAKRNMWGDLRIGNVFAPTIEWHIHQQPEVWDRLMTQAGFAPGRTRWDAPSKLRRPGQMVLGNKIGAYVTNSHFILTAQG
ncbi:class I SAM-dependent methyltransferase [Aeromicrobium sp. CF3.5]|uniref:class I SAM-dependent methyltransferase n=1 Tax=Aeromicrobium sp. CF3.5 TaxID=3373078 RepID=UPI003EE6BF94